MRTHTRCESVHVSKNTHTFCPSIHMHRIQVKCQAHTGMRAYTERQYCDLAFVAFFSFVNKSKINCRFIRFCTI